MNKQQIEKLRRESDEAWRFVMSNNQGRLVIREILQLCGYGQSPFNGATNQTIKNVGMQDVGNLMVNKIKSLAFGSYITMLTEESESD